MTGRLRVWRDPNPPRAHRGHRWTVTDPAGHVLAVAPTHIAAIRYANQLAAKDG